MLQEPGFIGSTGGCAARLMLMQLGYSFGALPAGGGVLGAATAAGPGVQVGCAVHGWRLCRRRSSADLPTSHRVPRHPRHHGAIRVQQLIPSQAEAKLVNGTDLLVTILIPSLGVDSC